jgi:hypothetical protein
MFLRAEERQTVGDLPWNVLEVSLGHLVERHRNVTVTSRFHRSRRGAVAARIGARTRRQIWFEVPFLLIRRGA